jgi:hypothetical protein
MSKEEKQKWTMDYINSQLQENSDRWVEVEKQLQQAQIEVDNLTRQKCHYDTIIYMLKSIQNGLKE